MTVFTINGFECLTVNETHNNSINHKDLMKKKQQCTHFTTKKLEEMERFCEPSSYVQRIALKKNGRPPPASRRSSVLSDLSRSNMAVPKMTHTSLS